MIKKIKNKTYQLLQWSQKYTQTDMIYLAHGGFWLTAGQILSSLSSFILAIAFANILPKETFGIYKYVLTLVGILTIPTLRNMNVSISQSVAQGNEGTAIAGIKEKIRWGLLGGLGAIIMGGYYFINGNNIIGTLLVLCAPFIPLKDAFGTYGSILNGKKDFKRTTLFNILPTILASLLTIAILYFTRNIYYILSFHFIFWTCTNFTLLKKTLREYKLNTIVDQKSISYGKHGSFIGIISTIAGYFDKLIIFHFLGAVSVATYSIAMAPASQINGVLGNINTLASPKFSNQTTDTLKSSLKNKEKKIILLTILISIVYIIFAKTLFSIFFPKYMDAILFSQIISVSIPLTIISRFRFTAIQSRFDKKAFYIYTSGMSIVQVVFNFIGIYFYGLFGIVLSYLAIGVCQFIGTGIILKNIKSHDTH